MTLFIFIVFICHFYISLPLSLKWNKGSTPIPVTHESSIGYYNQCIYIMGGTGINGSIHYNITSKSYYNLNKEINFGFFHAQSYTQIGDIMYMLPLYRTTGIVFDLATQSETTWSFAGEANLYRCISNYQQRLLIIGGHNSAHFYIYDISNDKWMLGPYLPNMRGDHSCAVVAGTVYVIGGQEYPSQTFLDDVQYLYINDIDTCCNGNWTQLTDRLSNRKACHRSVVFDTNIYVIGGKGVNGSYLTNVDVIDTISGTIYLDSHLISGVAWESAIVVGNIIYVFAGWPPITHYQKALINTYNPTVSPSTSPSAAPSRYPTSGTEYNKEMTILYQIKNLTQDDDDKLSLNNITVNIMPLIKTSYVEVASEIMSENNQYLQYRQFEIMINTHYQNIQHNNLQMLNINSFISYREIPTQKLITFLSSNNVFQNDTTNKLKTYFNNEDVVFSATVIEDVPTISSKPTNNVFIMLLIFIVIMGFGSFLAWRYNKTPGTKTDDSDWGILLLLSLHIADFIFDILLSTEIISKFDDHDSLSRDKNILLLHIAGICSILFIVIPYFINIYITFKIETYIDNNKRACIHFKQYRG
eukprot:143977_1